MDPLQEALIQRAIQAQGQAPPQGPAPAPVQAVPPNPTTKIPQAAKRFANAQAIQDAYRGNWTPNPVLLRADLGHR
jgi:hypothetical protein